MIIQTNDVWRMEILNKMKEKEDKKWEVDKEWDLAIEKWKED